MKNFKLFIKILVYFILFLICWYYLTFQNFNRNNIKKVLGILSLSNNFQSYSFNVTKESIKLNNKSVITISAYSKNLRAENFVLYDSNSNQIGIITYSDCILKGKNKCTYLVENYKVDRIEFASQKNLTIKINDGKNIRLIINKIKMNIIYSIFIVLCIYAFFKFSYKFNFLNRVSNILSYKNVNKSFIIIAFIFGVVSSIFIPLYQVPDELTHMNLIYQDRNVSQRFEYFLDKPTGAEDIIGNYDNKVNLKNYFNLSHRVKVDNVFSIPKITILRHFPQYIGMIIGELLNLPIFIYTTICELFALIFYIIICSIALRKIPFKKHIMMFIMLLPISMQQMASFSYDCILNAFCFLFISYILELRYTKEKISLKDIFLLLLILMIVAICKLPYIMIGGLFFILPLNKLSVGSITVGNMMKKISSHKKIYIPLLTLLGFSIILGVFYLFSQIDIGRLLIASVENPYQTLALYNRTIRCLFDVYLEQLVGCLGWFDTHLPKLFIVYVYFVGFVLFFYDSDPENSSKYKLNLKERIIFYSIFLSIFYMIFLSMISWTLYSSGVKDIELLGINDYKNYIKSISFIGGIQGRYFISILPLVLIPSFIKKSKLTFNINLFLLIYYIVMFIVFTITILCRYWI